MPHHKRLKMALLGVLLMSTSLGAQNLPLEQRIFILSKTYQSIPIQFAHWQTASYQPSQLDGIYQGFVKRAIETEGRRDFALLMREFIALLNNGHSWYSDRQILGQGRRMGLSWRRIAAGWTVTRSDIEGLEPGDLVLRINGQEIDELYQENKKYLMGSGERAKQGQLLSVLAILLPPEYTIEFQPRSGPTRTLAVDRTTISATQDLKTESRWIEPGLIGYIKIPSFGDPAFENDALEQLKLYVNAAALIIDVRGNGGGSTPEQLTRALMDRPYRWWTEGTPLTVGLFRFYSEVRPDIELNDYFRNAQLTWQSAKQEPDAGAFAGRLIILADRGTGSAAEDFTVPFKDNGRALIVGETTLGSTGQPYMFDFGDGISIGIGTKRAYMPDGSPFEGIGIQPDINVPLEREDLYSGRDRVLERAVEEIKRGGSGK